MSGGANVAHSGPDSSPSINVTCGLSLFRPLLREVFSVEFLLNFSYLKKTAIINLISSTSVFFSVLWASAEKKIIILKCVFSFWILGPWSLYRSYSDIHFVRNTSLWGKSSLTLKARIVRSSHEKLGRRGAQLGIYLFESQVFYFKKAKEEPFI